MCLVVASRAWGLLALSRKCKKATTQSLCVALDAGHVALHKCTCVCVFLHTGHGRATPQLRGSGGGGAGHDAPPGDSPTHSTHHTSHIFGRACALVHTNVKRRTCAHSTHMHRVHAAALPGQLASCWPSASASLTTVQPSSSDAWPVANCSVAEPPPMTLPHAYGAASPTCTTSHADNDAVGMPSHHFTHPTPLPHQPTTHPPLFLLSLLLLPCCAVLCCAVLCCTQLFGLARRHVTLSTVGVIPRIKTLGTDLPVRGGKIWPKEVGMCMFLKCLGAARETMSMSLKLYTTELPVKTLGGAAVLHWDSRPAAPSASLTTIVPVERLSSLPPPTPTQTHTATTTTTTPHPRLPPPTPTPHVPLSSPPCLPLPPPPSPSGHLPGAVPARPQPGPALLHRALSQGLQAGQTDGGEGGRGGAGPWRGRAMVLQEM